MEKENRHSEALGCVFEANPEELMPMLVRGLANYSAELVKCFGRGPELDRRTGIRSLIGEMAAYWGLDEDREREFVELYDWQTEEAEGGMISLIAGVQSTVCALMVLFRYADEMAVTHGEDERERIRKALSTVLEIAKHLGITEKKVKRLAKLMEDRL